MTRNSAIPSAAGARGAKDEFVNAGDADLDGFWRIGLFQFAAAPEFFAVADDQKFGGRIGARTVIYSRHGREFVIESFQIELNLGTGERTQPALVMFAAQQKRGCRKHFIRFKTAPAPGRTQRFDLRK